MKVFDSDDPKRPLRGGDVDLGIVYSGDAATLYQEDKRYQYIFPAEGAHQFIDNLCVPAGSAHKGGRMQVHQLHPAAGGEQDHLRQVPLYESERRGEKAAVEGAIGEPGKLSAEARDTWKSSATSATPPAMSRR